MITVTVITFLGINSGKKLYTPPPLPHFWPKGIFQGRGVGVYTLRPHAAGILYAPPFIHPPPLGGYFQGWGVGVYKIRPRINTVIYLAQMVSPGLPEQVPELILITRTGQSRTPHPLKFRGLCASPSKAITICMDISTQQIIEVASKNHACQERKRHINLRKASGHRQHCMKFTARMFCGQSNWQ